MKWPIQDKTPEIVPVGHVGDFAFRRSFYYHPGIDIYASNGQPIQAIEDGVVVHVEHFTGEEANPPSPWWNDTWAILIEGKSGVIGYCEILVDPWLDVGETVKAGDVVGHVIPVLKKDKGNGTTMLHLELYEPGTKHHVTWVLDTDKPKELQNPRELLEKIIHESV